MMLGSNAREDKCRECRGNNTNCHTNIGSIDEDTELRQGKKINVDLELFVKRAEITKPSPFQDTMTYCIYQRELQVLK